MNGSASRLLGGVACVVAASLGLAHPAGAGTVPPGFDESTALSGLTQPTAVQFARDGRIFVAEKSGLIKVFDGLDDRRPSTFADLRTKVYNNYDRGLLGMALDPDYPQRPRVYVLYTYDAKIRGKAPRWGTPGATYDDCPDPPGAGDDGCVVSARLSRLHGAGDSMVGREDVLINDWCSQYQSHTIGDLVFAHGGALYASGGDGASYGFTDYGQRGRPPNPCGDPPAGVGGAETPPSAEGGALRSQDLRTGRDAAGLDGTIIRVDPSNGSGLPHNPRGSSRRPNVRRIVAYGLRNPFRYAIQPHTGELWIGDVGAGAWEEIDRLPRPSRVLNFGWPCYEGFDHKKGYDKTNLDLCETLYASGDYVGPYFEYPHHEPVVPGEGCPTDHSSMSGMAFEHGGTYGPAFRGALFFADYSRNCIWVMRTGAGGEPDPSLLSTFDDGAGGPVQLRFGPDGDLYYVDINDGTVQRIDRVNGNHAPVAVARTDRRRGHAPLIVHLDGAASHDSDAGDHLSYAWDLDGDGRYDESTSATPRRTYARPGVHLAGLRVTDEHGARGRAVVPIHVGDPSQHGLAGR